MHEIDEMDKKKEKHILHLANQIMGRRGGLARAQNLSPEERKRIAAMGGRASARSKKANRLTSNQEKT